MESDRVPDRYRGLIDHVLANYIEQFRKIEKVQIREEKGESEDFELVKKTVEVKGAIVLEVDFDPHEPVENEKREYASWHVLNYGKHEITRGAPDHKEPRLLTIRVSAEKLLRSLETSESIREVVFVGGVQLHGHIDFAFAALSIAERIRADARRKED